MLSFHTKSRTEHGGEIRKGKRKEARPFEAAKPMHVVLRSTYATQELSFLRKRNKEAIQKIIHNGAKKFGVKILGFTNVGNHLHIIVKTTSNRYRLGRTQLANYLRYISGAIAFFITGARKGKKVKDIFNHHNVASKSKSDTAHVRFWNNLTYTRIIHWGQEYKTLQKYLLKNLLEAKNIWNRKNDASEKLFLLALERAGIRLPHQNLKTSFPTL